MIIYEKSKHGNIIQYMLNLSIDDFVLSFQTDLGFLFFNKLSHPFLSIVILGLTGTLL